MLRALRFGPKTRRVLAINLTAYGCGVDVGTLTYAEDHHTKTAKVTDASGAVLGIFCR